VKATTGIGIAAAFVFLLVAVIMEGGNPMSFISIPAVLIVIGGTFGVMMASTDFAAIKQMPKILIYAAKGGNGDFDQRAAAQQMVALAEKARRDGLLALEDDIQSVEDPFTKKGLQLVVDGVESDLVVAILQSEMDGTAARHGKMIRLWQQAGGFAPTLGIIGTVMSLVHVLENLDSPGSLGHSIAGAFVATLYGVGSANLLFLPIANKLKELSADELSYREMTLEAVLSIQAGDNPRMLREKLETFLPPDRRGAATVATLPTPAGEAVEDREDEKAAAA
jgi:chemotaxis protein MotA